MGGKIKKFFLSFSRFDKPAVLAAVFFSVFFGLVLPFHFADAFLGGLATAIGMAVAVTVLNIVLQVILVVSNLFIGLAGVILNWVISPHFMSLPYTYGGIVDVGWPIVRDFINMFFIIALVVIGLATALRIKEYQAQKTLPLLIIIAILINFTPVICGVIIDASNILMNFFLEELTGFKLMGNLFSTQGNMILGALTHFYNPLESLSLMGKALIMIIFDWVAAFIFFMFALLFVMRYIMVWVLVIVSPIAFFSRIFSGSQRYLFKSILGWDEWWKQFIEWSLIGVVAAFFIYLAEQLMAMAPGWIPGIPPGGAWGIITTPLVDFINQLLPWGVVLAFLMIGFFIATSTSAMGAKAITSFFQKKGAGMAKAAGRGVTTLAAMGGLRYLGKPAEAIAGRLERVPAPWAGEKGIKGVVSKAFAPGAAITRLAGAQLRKAPAAFKERMAGRISEQEKGVAGKSAETQATGWNEGYQRAVTTGTGWEKAIGTLRAAIKDGNLGDIKTALGLGDEEMKAMVKRTATEAAKSGKQKEILQTGLLNDSDIEDLISGARLSKSEQDIYGLKLSEADEEKYDRSIWKKMMAELKRDQMGNLTKPVALSDEFQEVLHDFGTGAQVGGGVDAFGAPFLEKFREEMLIRQKADPDWYEKNNAKMAKFLGSSPAQGLGLRLENTSERREKATREELERIRTTDPEKAIRIERQAEKLKAPPPEEEIERVEDKIAQQEEQMKKPFKPHPELPRLTEKELRERQEENLEKLRTRLAELKERVEVKPPEEEPLLIRIKKAKTKEERKKLEKEFKALPPELQNLERQIARVEGAIKTREALINTIRKRGEGIKGRERTLEETLEKLKETGAPAETINRTENRLATAGRERTGIEEELTLKERGFEAAKRRVGVLRENWKVAIREKEKLRTPEDIIREYLTKTIGEEAAAKKKAARLRAVKAGKEVIEAAQKELDTVRENREGWEGELAAQLKLRELGGKQEEIKSKLTTRRPQVPRASREVEKLSDKIRPIEKDIAGINKELPIRESRLGEIKEDRVKRSEEIRVEIEHKQLRLHPGMKVVPRKFLTGLLRETESKDVTFQAFTKQMEAAERALGKSKENLKLKEAELKKLAKRKATVQTRHDALIKEISITEQELREMGAEIGKIEKGEITPKLPRKEKKKLKKST